MKYKKIMILLLMSLILITISAVAGADNNSIEIGIEDSFDSTDTSEISIEDRTFNATGDTIGYSPEEYSYAKLSNKAKKQIKEFKNENKNNPTNYSITISEDQYSKLSYAKDLGKCKEIQIKTDKYITIKKPVMKKTTKKIFSKKYTNQKKYKKALAKLKNKYYLDDFYKIKVTKHGKYKQITVYKKIYTVKYFKTGKDRITASVCVNDWQDGGGDYVFFFAPKLGIDGTMAAATITIL